MRTKPFYRGALFAGFRTAAAALTIGQSPPPSFLWFVCLLPVTHYFNLYRGPNPIPLVAILMLGLLVAERRNLVRAVAADMDHAHAV